MQIKLLAFCKTTSAAPTQRSWQERTPAREGLGKAAMLAATYGQQLIGTLLVCKHVG